MTPLDIIWPLLRAVCVAGAPLLTVKIPFFFRLCHKTRTGHKLLAANLHNAMAFHTCGPNEAMVISGMCHAKPSYVAGGRAFVIPVIQQVDKLPLNTMTLEVYSQRVYTKQGVPISVNGIAQVRRSIFQRETHAKKLSLCLR